MNSKTGCQLQLFSLMQVFMVIDDSVRSWMTVLSATTLLLGTIMMLFAKYLNNAKWEMFSQSFTNVFPFYHYFVVFVLSIELTQVHMCGHRKRFFNHCLQANSTCNRWNNLLWKLWIASNIWKHILIDST